MAIGNILLPGVVQALVFLMLCQIEFHAIGINSPANGLTELLPVDVNLSCFHHLVGTESIEMRKGDFPYQLIERILRLEPTGLDVAKVIENILTCRLLLFG